MMDVSSVSQQVITKELHDHLIKDYDASIIPVCSLGEKVTLDMDLALRQIMELVNMIIHCINISVISSIMCYLNK